MEQPSQVLYMNDMEETGVAEASTQAQPATSPAHRSKPPPVTRPFTTLIDQQLANQKKLLEMTMNRGGKGNYEEVDCFILYKF